ncbi:FGGY-family carbohydrate kinase [Brachybacterium hainanense]|uniref:FGGY-family carbohydrate kinase n=1 Tax=Brachybacterium hainanense TaxID=1541174 RepID=A0ABV6R6Y7_9MICO
MIPEPVLLGLDVGTSSTKGVLVRPDGTVLAAAVRDHSVSRPAPGLAEMDPRIWWEELRTISRELTGRCEVRIEGVGVSGMGPCVALVDEDDEPVRPAILYGVDSRAQEEIDLLEQELGAERILHRSGCMLTAQAAGPKVLWIARHEPEAYARARRLLMPASYLVRRLTGAYVLDHASAAQTAPLYDLRARTWHRPSAERAAPGLALPRLLWAGEVAGRIGPEIAAELPGLRAGTPVIAGTIDAWAEASSIGVDAPGDLMLMYGTTTFLLGMTSGPITSRTLFAAPGLSPGAWTLSGGMAASGAITTWLRDLLGTADVAPLVAEAAASPPGARGLLMLPYFSGERSPIADPSARGVLAGLTLSHTRGDMYRAVLEAAAFGARHHLEELAAAGCRVERVRAVGGGTRTGLWPQIVSDATGLVQQLSRHGTGAAYGDAMLAARTVLGVDTTGWNPVEGEVRPDPAARDRYDEMYGLFRELYTATAPIAHALARIQGAVPG